MVRPTGFEPVTPRFIPLQLSLPPLGVRGLDFPFTLDTKTLGAARQVSTPSQLGLGTGLPFQVSPFLSSSTRDVSTTAPN